MNYLILVHKSPYQLLRLIARLDAEWVHFFIHVDKKCNITTFKEILPENERIHYVSDEERIDGRWGDLTLIDAALACMRLAIKSNATGHCALLSGQDYPLRTPRYIKDYLDSHIDCNFISIYSIPDPKKKTENGGYERFVSYSFDCSNRSNPRMKAKIQPLSFRLKTFLGFYRLLKYRRDLLFFAFKCYFQRREYPSDLAQVFNEFWCVLSMDAVSFIVNTMDTRNELREYYKYTHIPDETLFGSILCTNRNFKENIKPMCHYINWERIYDGSPKTLNEEDLANIHQQLAEKSYILFARKFEENSNVLDIIDKQIIEE